MQAGILKSKNRENDCIRLGLIAPKNSVAEQIDLLSFLKNVRAEPYQRGCRYDVVWFFNVSPELRWIKKHTDARTIVTALEPKFMYPPNYDADLLALADRYLGYRNFASVEFSGEFKTLFFPAYSRGHIEQALGSSENTRRDTDFCIFARHDPNIRKALGLAAQKYRAILAGPLFGSRVDSKLAVQQRCRYELITENDINEYYTSEKLGHALAAGCVPVYWGGLDIKDKLPRDLYIDMRDFTGMDGVPEARRVIDYCMTPGVYEKHARVVREEARDILLNLLSYEACVFEPVQRYIDELSADGWRSARTSLPWTAGRVRSQLSSAKEFLLRNVGEEKNDKS